MLDNPILNGSFTVGDNAVTVQAAKIDDLDEGRWYEVEVNLGSGPLRSRVAIDFLDPNTDPVGFAFEVLAELRKAGAILRA